jgi:hypothetical protein
VTYISTITAAAPLRYWPLDDAAGSTTARELIVGTAATYSGMTGGGAAPPGIGGVAPVFTGTEHLTLQAGAILGGRSAWTIEAWIFYSPASTSDTLFRGVYAECNTSSGTDVVGGSVNGGSSTKLLHSYGDDSGSITRTANSIFIYGAWAYVCFTRSGATLEAWWNAGRRMQRNDTIASSTWTNSGVVSWIGNWPSGGTGWAGRIAHVAVYNRVLDAAEQLAHYQAGTPLTRTPPTRTFWKPTSPWRQNLIGAGPTIAPDSAATVTKLVNQMTAYGPGTNAGGGPFFTVDSSVATQRVRIEGGTSNFSWNHPDLYNALGNVPIPAGFVSGSNTDHEAQIYNSATDELWEFWVMLHVLIRPEWVSATVSAGGTIPAGAYRYIVTGYNANGNGYWRTANDVTVSGSQKVQVDWGTVEGTTGYRVWRSAAGITDPYRLVCSVSDTTHTFTDDGSAALGATYDFVTVGATTDWGCYYAGYINGTNANPGIYEPPHNNWGASATSLPLWAGTVSLVEGMNRSIPHAIAGALPEIDNTARVYPAQRNDGGGGTNAIKEGTRFQLDPAVDISTISSPFVRAVADAYQKYGLIIRDVASACTVCYIEDETGIGRDFYPAMFEGKFDWEGIWSEIPWSSMRVIDPAWTEAQVGATTTASGGYWGVRLA